MRSLVQRIGDDLLITKNEAEIIAGRLLNCRRHELYLPADRDIGARQLTSQLIKLRNGMPVEYVTGRTYFLDMDLDIFPGVFIPRAETEFLVELAKDRLSRAPGRILEIGTGTGAISIALARIFADSLIVATDISACALRCAGHNIRKYGLEDRILLCQADRLHGLKGWHDLIISNPPYISRQRLRQLPRNVRDFEPILGLSGGCRGTRIIAAIILQGYDRIKNNGCIALEIDDNQVDEIENLLTLNGIENYAFRKDLAGQFRYLLIEKKQT